MKSLTAKFALFIILPVTIIVCGLSVTGYMMARSLLIEQIKLTGLNFLSASAGKISGRVVQIHSVLKLLAATENLTDLDDARQRRLFVGLKEQLGGSVTSVFMGFTDSRFVRAKTTPLPDGFDPRTRPWYRDALDLPQGVLDGVTDPYADSSTGRPTITVFYKVINPDGALLGVLGVDVDITQSADLFNVNDPFFGRGAFMLVNEDAVILLHPDVARVGTKIDQTGQALDRQVAEDIVRTDIPHKQYVGLRGDIPWYMGFYRTRDARTILVLSVPADTLMLPLHRLRNQMVALAGSLFLVLLLVLVVVARRIVQPIISLNDSAVQVTREGVYTDPVPVKSADEVGQLTSAFNEMMAGLQQRDFIRDTFGRYVTKEVVQELLDTTDGLKLGGEMREVTIMFSDLRGFTPLSEQLPPDQVIEVLNGYLSRMATVIERYNGTINEFIGDAILTIFGAPIKHGDSPSRAVACALAMQLEMAGVNRENLARGLPPLAMGIGINTGQVIVGNIGSEKRAKYGVVGHQINLASRVEGATAGGQILITPSTFERIREVVVTRAVLPMHFKGVEEAIDLYDVTGMQAPFDLMLPEREVTMVPLRQALTVQLFRMENKKEVLPPIEARLTGFAYPWVELTAAEQVEPTREVRIDFAGSGTDQRQHLFARVSEVSAQTSGYVHVLQISYASPGSTLFLEGRVSVVSAR